MTDSQLITIAIAIIVPLSLLLYSNSRVSDAKETLRAEMALGFERILKAIQSLQADVKALDTKVDTKLTIHELEHHQK